MAIFSVDGLDGLMDSLAALAQLPDDVTDEMLTEEAEVVEAAQIAKARTMRVYRTGDLAASITKGKPKRTKGVKKIVVSPKGRNRDGTRNAEVAFLNEFGVPGRDISAKPFTKIANEEAADEAVARAAAVYDEWLKSKGL